MHTFTIDDHLEIDTRLLSGRLRLEPSAAGEARVDLEATGSGGQALIDDARVELEDRGGTQRLIVHVPRGRGRPRVTFSLRNPGVTVTIACPPGSDLHASVASTVVEAAVALGTTRIDSASGDVDLGEVDGSLTVSSASGEVSAASVHGEAIVRTASGDVRVGDVRGDLTVRTASGEVEVRQVDGDLNARSVSGDLRIEHAAGGSLFVSTTSGDVDLAVAPGRGVHLDVASVSGDLRSDLDDDDGTGGVDVELRARTVSGDVHLRRSRLSQAPPT